VAGIASIAVADPAELWRALGLVVSEEACWVSGIRHELGGPGKGVVAWSLHGAESLDELPRSQGAPPVPQATPDHPNGVFALDHVVVVAPNLSRTVAAFELVGIRRRTTRDAGIPRRPAQQVFFKLGQTVVEVVGSATATRPEPAWFYGLAFTVVDLELTAAFLGERLRPPRDAVQRGRRIATLDRSAGSTTRMAFMSRRH